ncbi:hypothetical protein [Xanthomonas euvesicatoria]|uniref:hypothetical protein n=1 Tax=Xanthomonas euvesicatoria TaxID=456327 RepID=UPI00022669CD|nr:hypothetical protein [Xanthomonas euvesicatoria]AEO42222.1 hypothetical protein XACM_1949 [Xanthomonas euvesicatoria pv. citrumelo F1]
MPLSAQAQAIVDDFGRQPGVFLRAMQQVGLIGFEESSFEAIVDAVYQYGMRTITA